MPRCCNRSREDASAQPAERGEKVGAASLCHRGLSLERREFTPQNTADENDPDFSLRGEAPTCISANHAPDGSARLRGRATRVCLKPKRRYNPVNMKLSSKRDSVAVHQMGKVGSKSVCATLRAAIPEIAVYHTHVLDRAEVYGIAKTAFDADTAIQPHILESLNLIQWMLRKPEKTRLHLISLVRDPVARNISHFFHGKSGWKLNLPSDQWSTLERWLSRENPSTTEPLPESLTGVCSALQSIFLEKFPRDVETKWIDSQLRAPFGIDIYATPFSKDLGYTEYTHGNIRLLFLDMERLDQILPAALRSFLGIQSVTLARANSASDKAISPLYSQFLRTIRLPDSYLEEVYGSQFSSYFYSAGMIETFRKRWHRP